MSVYMEVQPLIMQKRMEEMEKLNPVLADTNTTETVPEGIQTNHVNSTESEAQITSPAETSPADPKPQVPS